MIIWVPQAIQSAADEKQVLNNLLKILDKYAPDLSKTFHCTSTRWAVYNNPYKFVRTENISSTLFNYIEDPQENTRLDSKTDCMKKMESELDAFLMASRSKARGGLHGLATNLEDEEVLQRLRSLGYIE